MAAELVQQRMLRRRRCVLVEDGIRVTEGTFLSGKTRTVPYEVLYGQRVELMVSTQEAFWLAVAAVCGAVACVIASALGADVPWCAGPVIAVAGIVSGIYFWVTRRDLVGYLDGSIAFYVSRDRPSAEAVDDFLSEARSRARDRVRARLLPLVRTKNEYADREQALLLRDKGIITDAECAEFVRERALRLDRRESN